MPDTDPSGRDASLFVHGNFSPAELSQRRRKVAKAIDDGHALLSSLPALDCFSAVRQTNEFYYLTGLDCLGAHLLLDAGGRSTLYLKPRNAKREDIDGPELSDEDGEFVRRHTGIEQVKSLAELRDDLAKVDQLYVLTAPAEGSRQTHDMIASHRRAIEADPLLAGWPSREDFAAMRLRQMLPKVELRNLTPILRNLRAVKSPAELKLMREAGRLTGLGVMEAMRSTRAGVKEYQLAAISEYVFRAGGSFGGAHQAIAASGDANIYAMHYWRANGELRDGDFVLLDYAPDYRYYTSDIGRMWPVSGTYSPDQRSLYGLCIEYHKLLLSAIRPGVTFDDIYAEVRPRLREIIAGWSFPDESSKRAAMDMAESPRPLSHDVGMAIHEVGLPPGEPLRAGQVFAVDPELFIRDQRRYIRCEDTVVVTEAGCEVLTQCPLEMDEVEQLMAEARSGGGGMLQQFPI